MKQNYYGSVKKSKLSFSCHLQIDNRAVGRFQILGGQREKKGTYMVRTYLRFSCERLWQGWLFQAPQLSKKPF